MLPEKNWLLAPPIPQVSSEVCSQTDSSGSSHGEIGIKGRLFITSLFSRWEAAIPARAPARPAPPRRRATATVRVKMIARRGERRRRRRQRRTRNLQKRFWDIVCRESNSYSWSCFLSVAAEPKLSEGSSTGWERDQEGADDGEEGQVFASCQNWQPSPCLTSVFYINLQFFNNKKGTSSN